MAEANPTTFEVWKDIPEFAGYQASTLGRIRSFRRRGRGLDWSHPEVLKHKVSKRGYHSVRIRHDSGRIMDMRVNRLILLTFVGPCPPGMVACHDPDHDPANNRLDNVRWDTHQENIRDAGRHGRKKVLSQEQIDLAIQMEESGMMRSQIADIMGVRPSCITRIMSREGRPKIHSYGGRPKVTC